MDMKPLVGLVGILIAAIASEFNDQATVIALPDFRGAFHISYDPGTWVLSGVNEGQMVAYEEVANKGKTSAENLKVQR
jgi:hypothetical protein